MHRVELVASVLLAAAMVGAIVYAAWVTTPAPAVAYTPAPDFTFLSRNATLTVQPGQVLVYTYSNATSSNYLAGLFNVTPLGDCGSPCYLFPGLFLMSPAEYSVFQSGGLDGYLSGAFYATNVSIFALLPPGTDYLLFWNHGDQFGSNLSLRFTAILPLVGYHASTKPPVPPSPAPQQVVLSSRVVTLGDAYTGGPWANYDVTLPPTYWNYTISGSFSVSGGAATLYFFTPTQFTTLSSSFGAIDMPSSYVAVFTVGPSAQTSFHASVPAGSYILVFTNDYVAPGSTTYPSVVVDVTQNITATAA